jgi:plasmid stabilization system protein ParE
MKLRFSEDALEHIDAIHDYIAERNPTAATRVVRRIRAAAEQLVHFPQMARAGLVPDTHEWIVRGLPYIIVYELDTDQDELRVLAVFHGARFRPTT